MATCEKTGDWWWIAQFVLMWFNGGLGVMHWNTISRNATCWREPKCLAAVWKLFNVLWKLLFQKDAEARDQFSRHFTQTCQIQYDQIMNLLIGIKRIHFPSSLSFPFYLKCSFGCECFSTEDLKEHRPPMRWQPLPIFLVKVSLPRVVVFCQ